MTDTATATPTGAESSTEIPDVFNGVDDLAQYLTGVMGDDEPKPGDAPAAESRDSSPDPAGKEDAKPEPAEELYTVKINGEERQVSREQLIRDYQTSQAANQRFEEAAKVRQQYEAQQAQLHQERQQLGAALQAYQQQLQQLIAQPPDPKLLDSDPVEFLKQQQSYNTRVSQWQQAQAAQAYLQQQQEAEMTQRQEAFLAEQSRMLTQAIPEWSDGKKAQAEKAELRDYLTKLGFKADEVGRVADHRQVVLARKAMMFDKLVAQRDSAAKQVKTLPPVRVEKPGASRDDKGRFNVANLPASMNIDQTAQALMGLFGGE